LFQGNQKKDKREKIKIIQPMIRLMISSNIIILGKVWRNKAFKAHTQKNNSNAIPKNLITTSTKNLLIQVTLATT
jgi:hypothetical protein